MSKFTLFKQSTLAASLLFSNLLCADWRLDSHQSQLNFISTKKGNIAEVHYFKTLSGTIDEAGVARLVIPLASVETSIGIRNERMRESLFETTRFPTATISTAVDTTQLAALQTGTSAFQTLPFLVDLHGIEISLDIKVKIIKLSADKITVSSSQPVLLNAQQFGLESGVLALQKLAQLPSISFSVPVTFDLTFAR